MKGQSWHKTSIQLCGKGRKCTCRILGTTVYIDKGQKTKNIHHGVYIHKQIKSIEGGIRTQLEGAWIWPMPGGVGPSPLEAASLESTLATWEDGLGGRHPQVGKSPKSSLAQSLVRG